MISSMAIDSTVIDMLRGLRLDGDPDPLIELSETFMLESATRMQQLAKGIEAGDFTAVRSAAHCLKGMSATVGAMQLSEMSRAIEQADASTIDRARIDLLNQEIERVAAALNSAVSVH